MFDNTKSKKVYFFALFLYKICTFEEIIIIVLRELILNLNIFKNTDITSNQISLP